MARAPSSPILLPPKLHSIIYNIHYDCTRHIIITVQCIIYTGFGGCHTHYILVTVALTLSASAMARAPSSPILLSPKLHNIIYNIHYDCTRHIIITVQCIIYTGFGGCHTHAISVIVALTLSAWLALLRLQYYYPPSCIALYATFITIALDTSLSRSRVS
jgi:hypothetical protein